MAMVVHIILIPMQMLVQMLEGGPMHITLCIISKGQEEVITGGGPVLVILMGALLDLTIP